MAKRILAPFPSLRSKDSALGKQSRVGFLAKNGDCCGEPAVITTQGNSLDSPCKAPFLAQKSCREQVAPESLQSPTAIPRIFEEEHCAEREKSCREQLQAKSAQSPESTFPQNPQSSHSPTAIPRILEEESQANQSSLRDTAPAVAQQSTLESSSRAAKSGVAIHKSAQVDSTFLPFALDFSSTRISSLKGGQGGYLRSVPPYPPPSFFTPFAPNPPARFQSSAQARDH